jgi:hypothetical protein
MRNLQAIRETARETRMVPHSTNRDRFVRVGSKRVSAAIYAIRTLSHFGDRNSYEVTEADIKRLRATLQGELDAAMTAIEKGKGALPAFQIDNW